MSNQIDPEVPAVPDRKMTEQQKQLVKWQNKLLPWLIIMPSILVLLFIYLANRQVNQFNNSIKVKSKSVTENMATGDSADMRKMQGTLDYVRWITLTRMEEENLNKRYHQGGLLLSSRIFIKYLGFLTGMIIAIVGAVFIIGKMSEDSSQIGGSAGEKLSFNIVSSSPGIIFGLLGTALMLSTILHHSDITINEQPMYLSPNTIASSKLGAQKTAAKKGEIDPAILDSLDKMEEMPNE